MPANTRIAAIDALRGFCLLGILFAHYIYWHSGGPLPMENYTRDYGLGSTIASGVNNILIFGKFFALFSFLFGLSFFLQLDSGMRSGLPFAQRYVKRLLLLFLIALLHQTFWMGDILIIYVPLGFILLLLRRAGDRTILSLAILLILNVPGKLYDVLNFFLFHLPPPPDMMGSIAAPYEKIIQSGSLAELWTFNWKTFPNKMHMQVFSGRLAQTLGYFLLGMYAGRQRWFEDLAAHRSVMKRYLKNACWIALAMLLIALGLFAANETLNLGWEQNPVVGFFFSIIMDVFNFSLVTLYITGVALLMIRSALRPLLLALAPVGKMALTSYLLQTVMGLILFFGFGFGLFQHTSPGWNLGIATLLFLLQTMAARWWFRHLRFGPVEWIWRSGTAGHWMPLRAEPPAP